MSYRIEEGQVNPGDIAVTDMHLHQANTGVMKDWEVYSPFEVPEEMFQTMWDKLPDTKRHLSGKTAYIVSTTIDVEGFVSSALVIYKYDLTFWVAVLFRPNIWNELSKKED